MHDPGRTARRPDGEVARRTGGVAISRAARSRLFAQRALGRQARRGEEIEPANLAIAAAKSSPPSFENMSIDDVEALLIRKVLRRCDGNISQAAESLGLSRAALYRRIEKYGL